MYIELERFLKTKEAYKDAKEKLLKVQLDHGVDAINMGILYPGLKDGWFDSNTFTVNANEVPARIIKAPLSISTEKPINMSFKYIKNLIKKESPDYLPELRVLETIFLG